MNEFSIIEKFFVKKKNRPDVSIGIGDDGAIVSVPMNHELVITTDTLVNNIHFDEKTSPENLGYKSLAVNLSDLAAMGATPAWFTLALTMPQVDENWLTEFSHGLFDLANAFHVQLIGGDITRGPLSITIGALGFVPNNGALLRSTAKAHDNIYVTGTLGDAGFSLKNLDFARTRLDRPTPRVHEGEKLRGFAHAAIDISDGLVSDLGHILEKSQKGAIIFVDQIPLSDTLRALSLDKVLPYALASGDDYELCFTMDENKKPPIECTLIGKITEDAGLRLEFSDGKKYDGKVDGYQHF
jgi:thiamine-monophosphate kinase